MTLAMEKLAERMASRSARRRCGTGCEAFYADMYTMYQSLAESTVAERSDKPGRWKLGVLTVSA